MNKTAKILIAIAVVLALLLGVVTAGYLFTKTLYIKVDGIRYAKNSRQLDLRGQDVSQEHVDQLQKALPGCQVLWDVEFQGQKLSSDTKSITITDLTQEDFQQLSYLKELEHVDATGFFDYEMIKTLQKTYPACTVDYRILIDGEPQLPTAEELKFENGRGSFEDLQKNLQYLPNLKSVYFEEPEILPTELDQLQELYPNVTFTWSKSVFGKPIDPNIEELDVTGLQYDSLEDIERQAGYLTNLKKLTIFNSGFDNDALAAYRDRVRDKYKVVWNMKIGQVPVRTDDTWFMPTKLHLDVKDRDVQLLRYCEDMICIDLGHNIIKNIEWVKGTPHLKYLIIADGPLRDISPIGCLKELKFLELFLTDIRDITPVLGCTALEDLNVARIPADLKPLAEMTWLKNLWMSGGWVNKEDEAYIREHLPNTRIDAATHHNCTGRGWRSSQNYIDMRHLLDMPIFLE